MGYNENCYKHLRDSRKAARKLKEDIYRTESLYVDRMTGEIILKRRLENGEYVKLKTTTKYRNNGKYTSKTITTECRENQGRLFEQ